MVRRIAGDPNAGYLCHSDVEPFLGRSPQRSVTHHDVRHGLCRRDPALLSACPPSGVCSSTSLISGVRTGYNRDISGSGGTHQASIIISLRDVTGEKRNGVGAVRNGGKLNANARLTLCRESGSRRGRTGGDGSVRCPCGKAFLAFAKGFGISGRDGKNLLPGENGV